MSKFDSKRTEVLYRMSLDGGCDDEMGDVQFGEWFGLLMDVYGSDYILMETSQGFVSSQCFPDHILIDQDGYFIPVKREWDWLAKAFDDDLDDDESAE